MKVKSAVIEFLLGDFRKHPEMSLGKNHISLLSTFMTGYLISLQRNGYDISTDSFFGNETTGFFEWYKNKTGILFSSNWYLIILEQCDFDFPA